MSPCKLSAPPIWFQLHFTTVLISPTTSQTLPHTHRSQFGNSPFTFVVHTVVILDAKALTLQVKGQVDNVPQVVEPVDVGVLEGGLEVVFDALDDDVGVHSQDGDEGGVVITEQRLYRV